MGFSPRCPYWWMGFIPHECQILQPPLCTISCLLPRWTSIAIYKARPCSLFWDFANPLPLSPSGYKLLSHILMQQDAAPYFFTPLHRKSLWILSNLWHTKARMVYKDRKWVGMLANDALISVNFSPFKRYRDFHSFNRFCVHWMTGFHTSFFLQVAPKGNPREVEGNWPIQHHKLATSWSKFTTSPTGINELFSWLRCSSNTTSKHRNTHLSHLICLWKLSQKMIVLFSYWRWVTTNSLLPTRNPSIIPT